MSELIFGIGFIILIIIFIQQKKIINYLDYNLNIRIENKTFAYILTFFFIILITMGMLFSNTKEKFSGISQNYDNIRAHPNEKKPHRYFDINTYD